MIENTRREDLDLMNIQLDLKQHKHRRKITEEQNGKGGSKPSRRQQRDEKKIEMEKLEVARPQVGRGGKIKEKRKSI
jgi:hypothetical protein